MTFKFHRLVIQFRNCLFKNSAG